MSGEVQRQQREMWTRGDYAAFAVTLQGASDGLVRRAGVGGGHDVLDVATGTGNAAVAAAAVGATVTGLDVTPELFEVARRRAAAGGWAIEWIEGDAQELPFAADSFDRVLSVFGAMFAPDQRRTAEELVRVCRPDGTIGVCAWTPDGVFGRMIALLMSQGPPPPPGFRPPVLWGIEDHVRSLFDGLGVGLTFEREDVAFADESAAAWVASLERVFGPVILARSALEPRGEWSAVRDGLVELLESFNESRDGRFLASAAYLVTVASS